MLFFKRKKPAKCRRPKQEAERYCLDDEDMDNLIKLMEEANGILDYYHEMPENLTGILATPLLDKHEELLGLVDTFRDALFRFELLSGGVQPQ